MAATTKKMQEKSTVKWGIWLHQSGTLSFGMGNEGEAFIDQDTYDRLKSVDTSKRWDARIVTEEPKAEVAAPEVPQEEAKADA